MKNLALALAAVAVLFSVETQAQKMNVGLHAAPSLPLGDFGDIAEFGIGGGLSLDYYFGDHFNIGLEGEYIAFPIEADNIDESWNLTPIQLTGAYHSDAGNILDLHAGTGIGVFIVSSSAEGAESSSELGITPRAGLAWEITDLLFFDFNIRYGLVFSDDEEAGPSNLSYLGFNVGLLYSLVDY